MYVGRLVSVEDTVKPWGGGGGQYEAARTHSVPSSW